MYNMIYSFFGLNKIIFVFINKLNKFGLLSYALEIFSRLFFIGNFAFYYLIMCLHCYYKLKSSPQRNRFFLIYNNLVKAGICYTLFGFTCAALKFSINLPRPFCSLSSIEFSTVVDTVNERCLSAFPSAHIGIAIIISYYLWPHLKKYQQLIICLLLPAVAISRITLAMHYPADLIYGSIIASTLILLSNTLVSYLKNNIIKSVGNFIFKKIF